MISEKVEAALEAYREAEAAFQEKHAESKKLYDKNKIVQEELIELRSARENAKYDLLDATTEKEN